MTSRQQGTTTRVSGAAKSTKNDPSARQGSKRSGQPQSRQMSTGYQTGGESRYQQTRMTRQGSQGVSRQTGQRGSRQTAGTTKSNRLVQSRLSNQVVFRHESSRGGDSEARSYASQYDDEDDEDGEYEDGDEDEEGEYENEDEEETEGSEDVQSTYIEDYYPEYASMTGIKKVQGPRVEIMDGPDPCHCFPKKSNKHIPSMVYENITCKHSGVKGEAHAGVFRFDFNWNEFMEEPRRRKRSQAPPKTNFVKGYPNPEFLGEYVEEEEGEDEDDDDDDTNQQDDEEIDDDEDDDYTYHGDEEFEGRWGKQSDDDDDDDDDDDEDEEDEEEAEQQRALEEAMAKPSGIRAIIPLPHIGYSPPPSRERSTPLSQRSVPYSLPPLPESPFMSVQSRQSAQSYEGSGVGSRLDSRDARKDGKFRIKKINTVRRFQGRMYDPASKKVVSYDITPSFRANLDTWHANIDSGSSAASGSRLSLQSGNRRSTVPSRRSVKVESRHTNIPEEDDEDEDDDDDDDDEDDDDEDDDEDDY
ncbi:FK506-binding protein 3-like [Pecten maximus]|uniref:FK506-binding protein 3-like n=1 Tax=Pecten maximus TaxID=6579 RepID=UPI001458F794|nr:FK506-binding protein 3-like [Pecten maximus]